MNHSKLASLAVVIALLGPASHLWPLLSQEKEKTDHKHSETNGVGKQDHKHAQAAKQKPYVDLPKVPPPSASAAKAPKGFYVQVVMTNLNYPSSIEFDDKGGIYVAEAGEAPGDPSAEPRVIRQRLDGQLETIISEGLEAPVTDLLWHHGKLYISHRGKISTWTEEEKLNDLVTGLPSLGDHHNNQMSVGPDGKIYFGQGTATNSGVVGEDNLEIGWLKKHPYVHDEPAKDIVLAAPPFKSINPFLDDKAKTLTSAFQPFTKNVPPGTRIKGVTKASGTILRMNPDGSGLEVYAWGLRNPYGLAWSPDGKLYASENGLDERGSRPIANDKEDIYLIKQGAWYGWPDFAGGEPVNLPKFRSKRGPPAQFLMKNHPPVEKPLLQFDEHSSITQMDFSRNKQFGDGHLFVAFFGHMTPMTGETPEKHAEHRVARIDLKTLKVETFFGGMDHGANGKDGHEGHGATDKNGKDKDTHKDHGKVSKDKGDGKNDQGLHKEHGKATKNKEDAKLAKDGKDKDAHKDHRMPSKTMDGKSAKDGKDKDAHKDHGTAGKDKGNAMHDKYSEGKGVKDMKEQGITPGPRRLIDVRFSPSGDALYVVDFGAMLLTPEPRSVPGTGVVWRIVREDAELPVVP